MPTTKQTSDDTVYSERWRARYGQRLTRDEIQLIQAFRGLSPEKQGALLTLASSTVLAAAAAKSGGAR